MKKYNGGTPALQCTDGDGNGINQFFDVVTLYPEYLTDINVLVCPSDADGDENLSDWHDVDGSFNPCEVSDGSYSYYGWAVRAEDVVGEMDVNDPLFDDLTTAMSYFNYDFILAVGEVFGNADKNVYDDDVSTDAGMTVYRLREESSGSSSRTSTIPPDRQRRRASFQ